MLISASSYGKVDWRGIFKPAFLLSGAYLYDGECDAECNDCKTLREIGEHVDTDEDRICDECGEDMPRDGLSGGAIAAIIIGATLLLGLGGFLFYRFVIGKE